MKVLMAAVPLALIVAHARECLARLQGVTLSLCLVAAGSTAVAATPTYNLLDPDADARTVRVWRYLQSQYGTKMLTAAQTETRDGGNQAVVKTTGQMPAIWGNDMNSWYKSRTDPLWNQTWNNNINGFKTAWRRGQIPQLEWHWQAVFTKASASSAYTDDAWSSMSASQWSDIVTPGTALYNLMIEDIDYHVTNFLRRLVDDDGHPLPILFRPLHEIDGGWFWWTCKSNPTNTAKLWQILHERIRNYHGCHNLIWVYSAGVEMNGYGSWPPYKPQEYPRRRQFYPGDAYCDIIGIDLYVFDPVRRGTYAKSGATYRDAWNVMCAVSSNKMIALTEAEGLPDAAKCFTDPTYAPWLYCLPWYANGYYDAATNPAQWVSLTNAPYYWNQTQYNSPYVVNATNMPDFDQLFRPVIWIGSSTTETGVVSMSWATEYGVMYSVYKTTNLLVAWPAQPLTNIIGNGATRVLNDSHSTEPSAFYHTKAVGW